MVSFHLQSVFHERFKTYKTWKDAEATLTKKRENKAKIELAMKNDKLGQANAEITEVCLLHLSHGYFLIVNDHTTIVI